MSKDIDKRPMQERFQHLFDVVSGKRFLNRQGLGNEVPFFICPFKAEEAVAMERLRKQLTNNLEKNGIKVLSVNLYDLSIELLKRRDVWNQAIELETTFSKAQLNELLQGCLDSEAHLVPAIAERLNAAELDVLFLSGVGEVFPFIRSHNVLNNLQSTAKEKPTVMFFPGSYTHSVEKGASLDLFGKLHDDQYYRAFNIFHYEP